MARESFRLNPQKDSVNIKDSLVNRASPLCMQLINPSQTKSILPEDQQSNMSTSAARLIKINA